MAEQSGGEEGWVCPKCGLKLPGTMVGMKHCPDCQTEFQPKTTQPKGDPSAAAGAQAPPNVGVGVPNSSRSSVDAQRTRQVPGRGQSAAAGFAPPTSSALSLPRDSRQDGTTLESEKQAVEYHTPIQETGSGNGNGEEFFDALEVTESKDFEQKQNETEQMTKQKTQEIAKEQRKLERRLEVQQRQEAKVKTEQEKKEERRKELEQRKASHNPQPISAAKDPLQSQTGHNEGEDDRTGGGKAGGKGAGCGTAGRGGGGVTGGKDRGEGTAGKNGRDKGEYGTKNSEDTGVSLP